MISLFQSLSWREPLWLLLALQPLVISIIAILARKLQSDRFASSHLLPWVKLTGYKTCNISLLKYLMLIIAWIAFAIAMAGPRVASKVTSIDESTFTNIIVLLDVSRSMTANDIHPSRLERAKLELLDLVQRSQRSRIGIILFATKAHVLSPLTSDKNLTRHYISTIKPSLLPTRGSNLKGALTFTAKLAGSSNTAILLISDGENAATSINEYEKVLSDIKQQNITIFSYITGTETGAPLLDKQSGWLTYENQDVISKANTNLLAEIALRTNGTYSKTEDTNTDWQKLYDNGIARINPVTVNQQSNSSLVIWKEYYTWFVLLGLISFVFANINLSISMKNLPAISTGFLVIMLSGLIDTDVMAEEQYQQAYRLYQQKDYEQAAQQFSLVKSYAGRVGQASAAYQNKDYDRAIMLFIQASLEAKTDKQRIHALFNLANSYYQLENYQQAIKIYQDILRYQDDHPQAKSNLAFTQAMAKKQKSAKDETTTTRGGRGPRTARLTPDGDIGKGSLSMGEESDTIPYAPYPDKEEHVNQNANIKATGLVTEDIESDEDQSWTYSIRNTDEIDAITNSISSNEHVFWQRLFEWEENFPAPLADPVTVPGVAPW